MTLPPNTLINQRYEVLRQVGQGGMGAVYEAIDTRLGHHVALKQTLVADPQFARAFEREARLLAYLQHPGLPRVTDYFIDATGQFLVMDFVPGDDLADRIQQRQGPFPLNTVYIWADQLLDALDYLHNQSPPVLHRDIKPQNLKPSPRGQLILLDFGLAKGALWQTRMTTGSSVMGYTPAYASMEQIQGVGTDARSDLYAVGATLYHLWAGTPPPSALERAALLMRGQPDPLVAPQVHNPTLPAALGTLLLQAMAPDPDRRPASAAAMRAALTATRTAPSPAPLPAVGTPTLLAAPLSAVPPTLVASPTPPAVSPTLVASLAQPLVDTPKGSPRRQPWPPGLLKWWLIWHMGFSAILLAVLMSCDFSLVLTIDKIPFLPFSWLNLRTRYSDWVGSGLIFWLQCGFVVLQAGLLRAYLPVKAGRWIGISVLGAYVPISLLLLLRGVADILAIYTAPPVILVALCLLTISLGWVQSKLLRSRLGFWLMLWYPLITMLAIAIVIVIVTNRTYSAFHCPATLSCVGNSALTGGLGGLVFGWLLSREFRRLFTAGAAVP